MYTVVYTSYTEPCTCSSNGPCRRPRTWTVCRNGPRTAVACRLGTCTRPGRPTCRIHIPDGPCTRPCNGRVRPAVYALCRRPKTAVYTANVHGRKRPCTRPVHCRVHEPIRPVHGRLHDTLHGRTGRVDGRFRPCRWPVHGRVHGPCTRRRQYTCRVHGRVHGPYMAVYTSRVWGHVRAMYTAEDVRTDGPYTVMYMGGPDRPCARPIHGRVRAVYTARLLYGRVRAVFVGEDVFTGRVHGRRVTGTRHVTRPCTRPVRGRTTAVYTAVDGPYTDV